MIKRFIAARVKDVVGNLSSLKPQPTVMPSTLTGFEPPKASSSDLLGRMREIISDPLNLLIERHPLAGFVDEAGYVRLHNGVRVRTSGRYAYYEEFSTILVLNRGVHEPLEEYVFQELTKTIDKSPVMLELGAYWGHYSMWMKSRRPESTVYLVEPDENNIDVGMRNFATNALDGHFIRSFVGRASFSVDAFMQENVSYIDVLHADIQGYEAEMLEGASENLRSKKIGYVFISTHSEELHAACRSTLEGTGYRIEVSSPPDRHSTSYDGFLFASCPDQPPIFTSFEPLGRMEISRLGPDALVEYLYLRSRSESNDPS